MTNDEDNRMTAVVINLTETEKKKITVEIKKEYITGSPLDGISSQSFGFDYYIKVSKSFHDQLQAQLAPPLAEPKGFGAIVEATLLDLTALGIREPTMFVRDGDGSWRCDTKGWGGVWWEELVNPKLIREGL